MVSAVVPQYGRRHFSNLEICPMVIVECAVAVKSQTPYQRAKEVAKTLVVHRFCELAC
jgi:hypothetical protein